MIRKSIVKSLAPEVITDLYEVPTGKKSEIRMIWITNPDSTNRNIELDFYDASEDETIIILEDYQLNQKDILQLGGDYNTFLCMKEGDKLMAEGQTNSNFTFIISVVEEPDIIQGG